MQIDPRKVTPTAFTQLLNSTPLGTVISERQLLRYRNRAGFRIGDGRTVDLYRFTAWMAANRHAEPEPGQERDYEAMKEAARARNAALSLAGRDIGELPHIEDAERRARGERDFRFFCEAYFPETFSMPWSHDHMRVIAKIERAVLEGGLFAMAMPRGTGKTALCETACLWAILYGHHYFVCLIGSDQKSATEMLESVKMELETNALILADFPEAVYPIHKLERIPHRATGQLYHGRPTFIGWTAEEIVMPTIAEAKASGAIIRVAGITGRIRGMKYKRPDGRSVRPSLVIVDDPQTDESARSPSQCQHRESILAGAVLGLAGPGKKISGIMPCTVISKADMADNILNRDKHPEWQGERTKLVYALPTNEKLWAEYEQIRASELRADRGIEAATTFYKNHRQTCARPLHAVARDCASCPNRERCMDAGAVVAWVHRHNKDEATAVQCAMNLKYQDEAAFYAEYQNEPMDAVEEDAVLSQEMIVGRVNGHQRGMLPLGATHLTAFIDVQQSALFYVVCGWEDDFTGYVVDYGTWPDQGRGYFTARDIRRTLALAFPKAGFEGMIYNGLEKLAEAILAVEWERDDGTTMRVARCLVDANWGRSTDVVYKFCRQSDHAAILTPSHGKYVGASSQPFTQYVKRPGDRVGHFWRMPNPKGRRAVRYVLSDVNYWKSFITARLMVAMGDPGNLSLYGKRGDEHRLFAEHLTAEYPVRTTAGARTVDEWKAKPGNPDNHWLDGVVGCAVAASIDGVVAPGQAERPKEKRERVSFAEMQRRRASRQ